MKKLALLSLMVLSTRLYSAELNCNIQINQDIMSEVQVTTTLDQKAGIDSVNGVVAYVTEKANNHYIVEAYLADYDLRVYGEGSIKDQNDRVVASVWGRDSMVDIECRLNVDSKRN
jgi:hypothetical protein